MKPFAVKTIAETVGADWLEKFLPQPNANKTSLDWLGMKLKAGLLCSVVGIAQMFKGRSGSFLRVEFTSPFIRPPYSIYFQGIDTLTSKHAHKYTAGPQITVKHVVNENVTKLCVILEKYCVDR